jgi:hypothetical protein
MSADNVTIQKALTELDSSNNDHWTDDGLPRVEVIQVLLKDPSITRKDIRAAAPTFSRATTDTTEPEDIQPGDPVVEAKNTTIVEPDAEQLQHEDGYNLDPKDPLSDAARLDPDQLKEVMAARITAAEARLEKARQTTRDAVAYEKKCTVWADQAKLNFNRVFPPMHPADAIKAHLASQLEQRYRAAGLAPPTLHGVSPALSPIEQTMMQRKRQGLVYQHPKPVHVRAG